MLSAQSFGQNGLAAGASLSGLHGDRYGAKAPNTRSRQQQVPLSQMNKPEPTPLAASLLQENKVLGQILLEVASTNGAGACTQAGMGWCALDGPLPMLNYLSRKRVDVDKLSPSCNLNVIDLALQNETYCTVVQVLLQLRQPRAPRVSKAMIRAAALEGPECLRALFATSLAASKAPQQRKKATTATAITPTATKKAKKASATTKKASNATATILKADQAKPNTLKAEKAKPNTNKGRKSKPAKKKGKKSKLQHHATTSSGNKLQLAAPCSANDICEAAPCSPVNAPEAAPCSVDNNPSPCDHNTIAEAPPCSPDLSAKASPCSHFIVMEAAPCDPHIVPEEVPSCSLEDTAPVLAPCNEGTIDIVPVAASCSPDNNAPMGHSCSLDNNAPLANSCGDHVAAPCPDGTTALVAAPCSNDGTTAKAAPSSGGTTTPLTVPSNDGTTGPVTAPCSSDGATVEAAPSRATQAVQLDSGDQLQQPGVDATAPDQVEDPSTEAALQPGTQLLACCIFYGPVMFTPCLGYPDFFMQWQQQPGSNTYLPVHDPYPLGGSYCLPVFFHNTEQKTLALNHFVWHPFLTSFEYDPVHGISNWCLWDPASCTRLPWQGPQPDLVVSAPCEPVTLSSPSAPPASMVNEAALPTLICKVPWLTNVPVQACEPPLCAAETAPVTPSAPVNPSADTATTATLAPEAPLAAISNVGPQSAPPAPKVSCEFPAPAAEHKTNLGPKLAPQLTCKVQQSATKRHKLPPSPPQLRVKATQLAPCTPRASDAASDSPTAPTQPKACSLPMAAKAPQCPQPTKPQQAAPQHNPTCAPVSQPGMVQPAPAAPCVIAVPNALPSVPTSLRQGPISVRDLEQAQGVSNTSYAPLSRARSLAEVQASMEANPRRSSDSSNPPAPSTPPAPGSTSGCAAANPSLFAGAAACNGSGACNDSGSVLLALLRRGSGGCTAANRGPFAAAATHISNGCNGSDGGASVLLTGLRRNSKESRDRAASALLAKIQGRA